MWFFRRGNIINSILFSKNEKDGSGVMEVWKLLVFV